MAGVIISLPGGRAVAINRRLVALQQRLRDLTLPMIDIGEYLRIAHDHRFQVQVSPQGTPWAPLSPYYLKQKPRNKDKVLVLYGHLKGTLHYNPSPRGLEFGSNRVYAATHQFGRGKIPARPFLGLNAGDRLEVLHLVEEWIIGV